MLDPGNLQGGGGGVVRARLDLCDLKSGLTIVSGAGPASCLHLGQEALHRIPMAELVLNRCVFVESSCHGQGHLNLLSRLGTEVAIAVHALDSVSSVSLVALALTVLSKLAHVGLLLASGVGITVTDVLAISLLGRALLLVRPCLAAASFLRVWSGDRVLLALPTVLVAPRAVRVGVVGEARVALSRECVFVVAHPRAAHVRLLVAELVHREPALHGADALLAASAVVPRDVPPAGAFSSASVLLGVCNCQFW